MVQEVGAVKTTRAIPKVQQSQNRPKQLIPGRPKSRNRRPSPAASQTRINLFQEAVEVTVGAEEAPKLVSLDCINL